MEVTFRTRKLEKLFNSKKAIKRKYGEIGSQKVMSRLMVLKNAATLSMVPSTPPERRHQLKRDRHEQFAVDLVHPERLVFEPNHDQLPRKEDGGIDLDQVTAITVLKVIDYHPK